MPKIVVFADEARSKIATGVDKLAETVTVTLGPRGRNVVLDKKFGAPVITNDGVTIAKEVELADSLENLGAQLVKEAATKTNDIAGDGTTTATVLARVMIAGGLRNVSAGANPVALKRGIDIASELVNDALLAAARPVDAKAEIANVAAVSAQDEGIGALIAEAMQAIGADGVITVEEGYGETELEITEGLQFDKGFVSPHFMTDPEAGEAVLEDARILICATKISAVADIVPLLEKVAEAKRPLLIIAEDIEGEALATLVVNALRKTVSVVAVKAPGFGDRRKAMLQDMATLTGAQVVAPEIGLTVAEAGVEVLGGARRVVVTKDLTTIVDGAGDGADVADRITQLRAEIAATDSEWDREKLEERLAKLAGGVAVVKVGAATEVELKERKHRIEDAIAATKAAVAEGVVAGGGVALVKAAASVAAEASFTALQGDERTGAVIVRDALSAPLHQIASNAGFSGEVAMMRVAELPDGHGFNAATGEYGDLVAAGILDPVMVTRNAVRNAASIAGLAITTDGVVAEAPAPEEDDDHGHSHSHGGHSHSH